MLSNVFIENYYIHFYIRNFHKFYFSYLPHGVVEIFYTLILNELNIITTFV